MPKSNAEPEPDAKKDAQIEEFFAQAEPLFNNAVCFAFLRYGHLPSPEDVARLRQRLSLLLLEDDFHRLRSYDHRAKLETWLQTVANHCVSRFLRARAKDTSLEDAPPEHFIQQPTQEASLLEAESKKALKDAVRKLTLHDRKLFEFLRQGVKSKEIARYLNITVTSVYREKNALIKKIEKLMCRERK